MNSAYQMHISNQLNHKYQRVYDHVDCTFASFQLLAIKQVFTLPTVSAILLSRKFKKRLKNNISEHEKNEKIHLEPILRFFPGEATIWKTGQAT